MNSQKFENLLNLSLDSTPEERRRSPSLSLGYDFTKSSWEVIVRYQGTLSFPEEWGIQITELLGNYAVLIVPSERMEALASFPQITYVEKPKRLFFAAYEGRLASCITQLQQRPVSTSPGADTSLYGRGILVACIDSGVDYTHPDFRNADGTTRLVSYWDQTLSTGEPPKGYHIGTEFTASMLNQLLNSGSASLPPSVLRPTPDSSGHGTAVLGIAAGNGRASDGVYRGVASESMLIAVKLGTPTSTDFPRTTQLMQALDYVVRYAVSQTLPLAVNLSFGNNYGSHSGDSLLETYINTLANYGQNVISIGSGNEGSSGLHASGSLTEGTQIQEFAVGSYQTSLNIQLWKSYPDDFDIYLRSPGGTSIGPIRPLGGTQRLRLSDTELLIYYGFPSPYAASQEIYFDFLPSVGSSYLASGLWQFRLVPRRITDGGYHLWMPGGASLGADTRFLTPSVETTLTIPSTAFLALTVGAYDSRTDTYADFSGRGFTRILRTVKPDLVAPGVAITAPRAGKQLSNSQTDHTAGFYGSFTGTSFAAPFVTGSAALLMEWGILRGNDPYLYGEKVKAYLRKGARQLPGMETPNPRTGWGALCVRDSLPL
ncbi:MAG: S8 family serine peptidase [Lachnospiraceae bacterium]|nr:S8 family serine peptidase [Lachnospiraceae bacterium]